MKSMTSQCTGQNSSNGVEVIKKSFKKRKSHPHYKATKKPCEQDKIRTEI